jgi:nucleoside diphosphate kinase
MATIVSQVDPNDIDEVEQRAEQAGYTITTKKVYQSQANCAQAFSNMHFPIHNVYGGNRRTIFAKFQSSPNYVAQQRLDGAGKIMHYSTLAGIRTRHGLTITNTDDYAKGWATVTPPADSDARLPLSSMNTRGFDICDICMVSDEQITVDDGESINDFYLSNLV